MALRSHLRQIPATVALLDAAVAALSATLLPARLIPENLDVIGPTASLLVLVAFLITLAYPAGLRRRVRLLAGGSLAALLLLLALQLALVVPVSPYGPDAGTHRFLVGWTYSGQGREWVEALGPMSASEYVAAIGDDRIRAVWGGSYLQAAGLYAFSYMAFVLGVALTLGAVTPPPRRGGGASRGRGRAAPSSA